MSVPDLPPPNHCNFEVLLHDLIDDLLLELAAVQHLSSKALVLEFVECSQCMLR